MRRGDVYVAHRRALSKLLRDQRSLAFLVIQARNRSRWASNDYERAWWAAAARDCTWMIISLEAEVKRLEFEYDVGTSSNCDTAASNLT